MNQTRCVKYELLEDGSYQIDNYDLAPAFSSFLPGVAGPDGVPLWCFYVNRAQAVVSFGTESKNRAVVEYLPATWAYQLVGVQGFRTFCKLDGVFHEPFSDVPRDQTDLKRTMRIGPDVLALYEDNHRLNLNLHVRYCSPVNRPIGSLFRIVTITNTAETSREITLLDGLPIVIPAGLSDYGLKAQRHINEAYASVRRVGNTVPLYSAKVVAHDEAEVTPVNGGNFYAGWIQQGERFEPVEPIVDPGIVFGTGADLITPRRFIESEHLDREQQLWENRLPCAFVPACLTLTPAETIRLVALIGYTPSERALTHYLSEFSSFSAVEKAVGESRELNDSLVAPALTLSALPTFDAYARQNFLDNVLRGGIPLLLPSRSGPAPLHLYARRHGDLERDYNHFVLPATPLSNGAGNYRDVCQNRRCDIWFYPDAAEHEIHTFINLIQADGYNPLALEGYRWTLQDQTDPLELCPSVDPELKREFIRIVENPFCPGVLLDWLARHDIDVDDPRRWLHAVLERCESRLLASGHAGGYWIDHWTYIVDLLEQYAAVYPDRIPDLLHHTYVGWFDEGAYVRPRSEKYQQRPSGLMQLDAVHDESPSKEPLLQTSVFGKLCALLAIKSVSFDAACKGIEMEAGRPGWNDAMNGLPALFGSSTCETAETARLARWLQDHAGAVPDTELPSAVADLLHDVADDLAAREYDWNRATTIRERFRARVRYAAKAETRTVEGQSLTRLLEAIEARARRAIEDSVDEHTGLLHTYFVNEPAGTVHEPTGALPTRFTQKPLPLFLEGQVHWLRLIERGEDARSTYQRVRRSPLFDKSLKMYKLNENLDGWPAQIGRIRTFTRGWFENESIWLHMSYKYLLELLRAGLYDEFFEDANTMLVPFMDPQRYGRSILENCSFLGSSVNPDPATHGRGFIARLSGSTAEFIQIWLTLTAGPQPFCLLDGQLHFQPSPALPGEWFTHSPRKIEWRGELVEIPANTFSCALLGSTLLVYHNERRMNTYGKPGAIPIRFLLDESTLVEAPAVTGDWAERIRNRTFRRIDVWVGSV